MMATDGEDIRKLPLTMRKTNLARLLARGVDGIFVSDFEQGEIGPELFRHACMMGLEGPVSSTRNNCSWDKQFQKPSAQRSARERS